MPARFKQPYFILISVLFFSLAALGQTTETPQPEIDQKALIRFAAIVQYSNGFVYKSELNRSKTALEFKSSLFEGERFIIGKNSSVKFVTRENCTVVVYSNSSEAQVLTPLIEKPWRIKSDGLRWICPADAREVISFRGTTIELMPSAAGSEFLIDGNRLLVLRGQIQSASDEKVLASGKLYHFQDKKWQAVEPELSAYELWRVNQSSPPPKESMDWPVPDKPITSRWILTPQFGSGRVYYDNHDLNQDQLTSNGARIQMQRRWGEGSLIATVSFHEAQDKSKQGSQDSPQPQGVSNDLNLFTLEAGYRFHHEKWWSPFVRFGVGADKAKIQIARQDVNYYSGYNYQFYTVNAAFGIDSLYRPKWLNWFGLYAGADIDIAQSVARDAARSNDSGSGNNSGNSSPPPEANEPWRLTEIYAEIMLGAFLQF